MPCVSGYDDGYEYGKLKQELDRITDMLCWTLANPHKPLRNDILEWWQAHLQTDAFNKAEEKKTKDYQARLAEWEKNRPKK